MSIDRIEQGDRVADALETGTAEIDRLLAELGTNSL